MRPLWGTIHRASRGHSSNKKPDRSWWKRFFICWKWRVNANFWLVIRTSKEKISGEFLARFIRHLESKVLQLVSGSTVFHLYASSIDKLVLAFPSKKEQQKIADSLSSIDELITAQAQKLEALKAHKKGLMQQLFPGIDEEVRWLDNPLPTSPLSGGGVLFPPLKKEAPCSFPGKRRNLVPSPGQGRSYCPLPWQGEGWGGVANLHKNGLMPPLFPIADKVAGWATSQKLISTIT